MSLFKRRDSSGEVGPARFWAWWSTEGRTAAEASIAGSPGAGDFGAEMTRRVEALGRLGWELAAGENSEHVLVITAEGSTETRALARRIVLAAPDADPTWSYVDARPPSPDPESVVLTAGGAQEVDLGRVQVAARVHRGRFDVQVHHPVFADVPEQGRAQLARLALDAALGELDTELWIGDVQPAALAPLDGFGLTALRAVVHDLKRQHVDADGRPRWTMLRGETPAGPLSALVRASLHPGTAPHLDTYVAVAVPYSDHDAGGLPGPGSTEALGGFEERLRATLGASGELVAHLSTGGVRTFHVYVDSTAGLLPRLKQVARTWTEGRVHVHEMRDPGWDAVQHLRVQQ